MTEDNLSLAELNPTKVELQHMAAAAKSVDVTDIPMVRATRFELRDVRINITKKGKELRDGAITFQKAVIAKEKELIGIIEPEENRLSEIEETAKLRKQMEDRRTELPTRIEALKTIGDDVIASDEELLALDDDEFNAYRLRRIDAKLIRDREAFEEEKKQAAADALAKQIEEEKERRVKQDEEDRKSAESRRVEEAKLAEERKALDVERAKMQAIEDERRRADEAREREIAQKEREEKIAKDKAERETQVLRDMEEAQKREATYQAFLKEVGYDEATGITRTEGNYIKAYKLIGQYKLN